MIQRQTVLEVADNSGAKKIRVITVLGSSSRRYGRIGDIIRASTIEASSGGTVKKKDLVRAVIIRTKKEKRQPDGTYFRFSDNAAVILDEGKKLKGTRIFGPVPRVLKKMGYTKVVSLAKEVL